MITAEEVLSAQVDKKAREKLIEEALPEIRRCASKTVGRWVDEHDDIYSVAMIAFNDAITAFNTEKGDFSAFAKTVIHNRIMDHLRQIQRHGVVIPFSTLSVMDDNGEEVEFETEDPGSCNFELAVEIASLEQELKLFKICFCDLPTVSPKAEKTRKACRRVVSCILENGDFLNQVLEKKQLPGKQLLEVADVNEKVLERHRKYIIAGVLICAGGYTDLREYFYGGEKA